MKHYPELDIVRSICIVYIVGIWHMNSYLSEVYYFSGYVLSVLHNITVAILGTFTFLSGVLLSKYCFASVSDVARFFKKRLLRFFLLLLLSALSYRVLGWINTKQVIQVVCGANLLFGPEVPTLWYFSMIILFYLLTPVIKYKQYPVWGSEMVSLFVLGLLAIAVSCGADKRLVYYFPCYILGLFLGSDRLIRLMHSRNLLYMSLPLSLLLFIPDLPFILSEIAGGVLIITLSSFTFSKAAANLFAVVSFSSMIMYLFHRQFFSGIKHACYILGGFDYIPIALTPVLFALLVIVSYYAQSFYNRVISKVFCHE